jgi:hypothetical protein
MKLILQWVLGAVAVLVVGPIAGWAVGLHDGIDGSGAASMLLGASAVAGILGHGAALALATGMGWFAARLTSGRFGLFAAGAVLAWPAAMTGSVERLLPLVGPGALGTLMIESVILGAGAAALAWVVCRDREHEIRRDQEKALSGETALAVAAAFVAGGLAAWLVAQDDDKGQTIFAAAIGGIAGGILARVLAHRAQGWAVVLGAMLAGVAGPVLAMQFGVERMLVGLFADDFGGSLARVGRLAPMDWVSGVLMGAPIGMTWAGSMVEKRHASEHPQAADGRTQGA